MDSKRGGCVLRRIKNAGKEHVRKYGDGKGDAPEKNL